jgi:Arc/MetJ family transcription regulator
MRTTFDIPEKLIIEAMRITGAKTKSQMIKEVLEAMIKMEKRKRLIGFAGKINLDIDLDQLRQR